ncbi:MAG: hypothetical protein N4A72_10150 [Bacteroidales bacterium]|jgi:hypothetical protein|nr:hypothetical protein [Bacteroidales bacterium]
MRISIVLSVWLLFGLGSIDKIDKVKYVYKDQYRNVYIEFEKSGKFYVSNNTRDLFRNFSGPGRYKVINSHSIVVIYPDVDSTLISNFKKSDRNVDVKPGDPIDWRKAKKNKHLVMPFMFGDTLRFSSRFKKLYFRDFVFEARNKNR